MQHLGEISTAQRSRGEHHRDKCCVKARKGFSNRRFERRFWVLLPPRAKVPRAGARNIPLDNPSVAAKGRDTSATLRRTTQCEHWAASQREGRGCYAPAGAAGRCTPRVLVSLRFTAWASPPTDGFKECGALGGQGRPPYGHIHRRCSPSYAEGDFLARKAK